MKKVNRRTIIDMPWWDKTWHHSGYDEKPKVIYTDKSSEFGKSCGKNMLDVCCDPTLYNECIAMVETGNECQLTDYMASR